MVVELVEFGDDLLVYDSLELVVNRLDVFCLDLVYSVCLLELLL